MAQSRRVDRHTTRNKLRAACPTLSALGLIGATLLLACSEKAPEADAAGRTPSRPVVPVNADVSTERVVLNGSAINCEDGRIIKIPDLEVRALDASTNQKLVSLLRTMDTVTWVGDGVESMSRYEDLYEQVVTIFRSSKPLAQDTTSATGIFSLSVPSSDSIVVIAQADIEDMPVFYGYRMVAARRNATVEVPMFRVPCVKRKTVSD